MNALNKEDALRSIRNVSTEEFTQFVRNNLIDEEIQNIMLDVNNYKKANQYVNAYVKTDDRSCIFSWWTRGSVSDMGLTSLTKLEVDILKDL